MKRNIRYPNMGYDSKIDLSISYRNFDLENENRYIRIKQYGNDLKEQIREKEFKKAEEKKRKKLEELREEERLKNEQALIERRTLQEENRRREELEKNKQDNQRIMNSFVVMSKPKNNPKINSENQTEKNKTIKLSNEEMVKIFSEQRRKEISIYNVNIQNNLEKLKNELIDQQNKILKEINRMREVNLHNNLYKIDIHKSLNDIREELKKKKYQEDLQKNFLYNSLVDSKIKQNKMNNFIGLDKIYLNKSHNILNLRENVGVDNKFMHDADYCTNEINKNYDEDKLYLVKILNKNEERLLKIGQLNK